MRPGRRPLALLLAAAGLAAAGCGGTTRGEVRAQADVATGKELYVANCGGCHTLADAATVSQVGPNLDQAFRASREDGFGESTIFDVTLAQIRLARGGEGMPPDIVTGQDAIDVAGYVASVAGAPPGEEGGGGETTAGPG